MALGEDPPPRKLPSGAPIARRVGRLSSGEGFLRRGALILRCVIKRPMCRRAIRGGVLRV